MRLYHSSWEKVKKHTGWENRSATPRLRTWKQELKAAHVTAVLALGSQTHTMKITRTLVSRNYLHSHLNVVRLRARKLNVLNLKAFMKPQGEEVQINTLWPVVRCIWCNIHSGVQKSEKTLKININLLIKIKMECLINSIKLEKIKKRLLKLEKCRIIQKAIWIWK